MVHHPLLAGAGALAGAGSAAWYARHNKLPFRATADVLAPPLAAALAFEQLGALAAGSGYGADAGPQVGWAIIYSNPMAAIWSGTPLGVPLHPVQAYAALAFLALAVLLWVWLPLERRPGDVAGLWLLGAGVAIYYHRVLARLGRPRLALQWRDRRPADRGCLSGARRSTHSSRKCPARR